MANLALSQDFVNLTEKIKRDLNITILPWVDRSGNNEETIIRFCLNRSNVDFLATSRDLVEEYLVQRNVRRCCLLSGSPRRRSELTLQRSLLQINLYPGSLRPRSDSFADVFAPFNSKLLSTTAMGEGDSRPDPRPGSDRKLRLAASSPNIKAIFDAKPGGSSAAYPHHAPRLPSVPSGPPNELNHADPLNAGAYAPFYPVPPVPRMPQQYGGHQPPPHHHMQQHHPFAPGPFAAPPPPPPQHQHQHQVPPHQGEYHHWGAPLPPRAPMPQQGYPGAPPPAASGYAAPAGVPSPQYGAPAPVAQPPAVAPTSRFSNDEYRASVPTRHHGASASFSVAPAATSSSSSPAEQPGTNQTLSQSASVEDKLKELSTASTSPTTGRSLRALAGRAQSLDLSQHAAAFSRASTAPRHESVDEVAGAFGGLGLS